jgi:ribosomal subunit interface protein
MQVNIHTDNNIECHPPLMHHVDTVLKKTLAHFATQITRVEVHLSDENAHKSSDNDLRCMMEARLQGYQPIAISEHAGNMHQAIQGAADKLKRAIENAIGRLGEHKKNSPPITESEDNPAE